MNGSVSVIIPAFNCEQWVREAIGSALGQTAPPLEVIVIDDGSTDGTPAILAEYGQRVKVISTGNQGVAAARNAGIAGARGAFIAFLDADDVWHPQKLERQLRAMGANPRLGLTGTRVFDWPRGSMPAGHDGLIRVTTIGRDQLTVKNYLTTSTVVVRREAAQQIGEFDVHLQGPEDHDYWLRGAEVTGVGIVEQPLTGYRSVEGSLSTRPRVMEAGMRRILRKLDERDAWRGNWVLRRKARSYCGYSSAYLYGAAGDQWTALRKLVGSFLAYPLPYEAGEVRMALARLRMLSVIVQRIVGREPGSSGGAARTNIRDIAVHVRRGQGRVWGGLKGLARRALTCHLPVNSLTRPLLGRLYDLHVLGREGIAWALRFLWYEPLFRGQCVSVGGRFQMEQLPYIAGRGDITVGERVRLSGKSSFGFSNRLGRDPSVHIGDGTFIGHDCSFGAAGSISIGKNCLLAGGVSIRDFDGHPTDAAMRREHQPPPPDSVRPVVIGDDVWIGAGAMVLKGVRIGDRSIVGAGAVVTRDVPADSVVAGNPARVVRTLDGEGWMNRAA